VQLERPPLLSPFGDGTQWIVWQDMEFVVTADDKPTATITVPRGFVTDLASTPKSVWSLYPPFGKYLAASILHDYLYWRQSCRREDADKIFYQTMRDAGVDQATQSRFYLALSSEGEAAWNQNRAEQQAGLIRVIPEEYLGARQAGRRAGTVWTEFRESLLKKKVRERAPRSDANIAPVCTALANGIEVKAGAMATVFGR
jgi:hypothetical protein